jgi:hypothetical protein
MSCALESFRKPRRRNTWLYNVGERTAEVTPEKEAKRVKRALRTIPKDAIGPSIADFESQLAGMWCIVAGELLFVSAKGLESETTLDDPLAPAQIVRWIREHPERIHETQEAALAFVRAHLGRVED